MSNKLFICGVASIAIATGILTNIAPSNAQMPPSNAPKGVYGTSGALTQGSSGGGNAGAAGANVGASGTGFVGSGTSARTSVTPTQSNAFGQGNSIAGPLSGTTDSTSKTVVAPGGVGSGGIANSSVTGADASISGTKSITQTSAVPGFNAGGNLSVGGYVGVRK